MVSGGWFSSHESISPEFLSALAQSRLHGVRRRARLAAEVHHHRDRAGHPSGHTIDPSQRRPVWRGPQSPRRHRWQRRRASFLDDGHSGCPGDSKAKDPVDPESSAVQCVACFFPPTDFLNYSRPGDDAVGFGVLKSFKVAFGPRSDTAEERQKLGREMSPIYFVHSNMPPMLIMHGDADKLVPIYQVQTFVKRCEAVGSTAKLVVREGKNHGWPDMGKDVEICADWFDEYLRGIKPKP